MRQKRIKKTSLAKILDIEYWILNILIDEM